MDIAQKYRPRRSCLYMPGTNERALEKAKSLPADVLILDLEDAVAPEAKVVAREAVREAVSAKEYAYREVLVRSNALESEWGETDLEMAVAAESDGVLVPKISSANDIVRLNALLNELDADECFALWVMIEVPLAILNLQEIAACAASTRLQGFVLGLNDLAKETHAVVSPDRHIFHYAMSLSVLAARAHGLTVIDGVYNDLKNESGFNAECEQARGFGFDGKSLIHPCQIASANEAFSPSADAITHANDIIEAFALKANEGKGVINVNGAMVELLHLEQAHQTVAIHEAISKRP